MYASIPIQEVYASVLDVQNTAITKENSRNPYTTKQQQMPVSAAAWCIPVSSAVKWSHRAISPILVLSSFNTWCIFLEISARLVIYSRYLSLGIFFLNSDASTSFHFFGANESACVNLSLLVNLSPGECQSILTHSRLCPFPIETGQSSEQLLRELCVDPLYPLFIIRLSSILHLPYH